MRVEPQQAWDIGGGEIDLPDASFDMERLPIPFPRADEPE